jgi:hypothetical protein
MLAIALLVVSCAVAGTSGASLARVPAWASKCLPEGAKRLGPAPKYVGLTRSAALRLKNSSSLVFAGGGGVCASTSDLVYRSHPIAVVYNTRNGRGKNARIIAAARAVAGWQPAK